MTVTSTARRVGSVAGAAVLTATALMGVAGPAAAAPARSTVTALSATTGGTAGGTRVTVTGTGFAGVRAVHFGRTAARYAVHSATSIPTAPSSRPR